MPDPGITLADDVLLKEQQIEATDLFKADFLEEIIYFH